MAGVGDSLGLFGNAASSLFAGFGQGASAAGSEAAADSYRQAAQVSLENARLSGLSTQITETQLGRQVAKAEGSERAAIGGSGFAFGGSGGDILRASHQEGALAQAVMGVKGQMQTLDFQRQAITEQGAAAQADAAAMAAKTSQKGSFIGAGLSLVGGLFGLFSDERLKKDIVEVADRGGIKVISFRYIHDESDTRYLGVSAQQVRDVAPWAVHEEPQTGFLYVDYAAIECHDLLGKVHHARN